MKFSSLPANKLRATLNPKSIPYATSSEIPNGDRISAQQTRALQALELSTYIKGSGYNIYLCGETNLGRTHILNEFLQPKCKKMPSPPDLLYLNNFSNQDNPKLIKLPAGQGKKLKTALSATLTKIRKEISARLENDSYTKRRTRLLDNLQNQKDKVFKQMDDVATTKGFNLDMDNNGSITLFPLIEGKKLSEQEYADLEIKKRKDFRVKGDNLIQAMSGLVRKLSKVEQNFLDDEKSLEKTVATEVLKSMLTPLVKRFYELCKSEELNQHFKDMQSYILEELESFLGYDHPFHSAAKPLSNPMPAPLPNSSPALDLNYIAEEFKEKCELNLFVDNSETKGAPIVFCDHPTTEHLLGCIERESEMGTLSTNFSLIKAGALHKANGGYLILRVDDILQHSSAWEGLLRSLRSDLARIEDPGDTDAPKTKGITPDPIPLSLKIVLIGTEDIYEHLFFTDERFGKLFKIKAQLTEEMPRNVKGTKIYLKQIKKIIDESELLPFDKEAMAKLIDFGSSLTESQKKLSLKFPLIREIMIEASALATMNSKILVDSEIMLKTIEARNFRGNLIEEEFMEEYDEGIIKVDTKGEAIGRINGLSVSWYGNFEFGLPHQIAATVGVGNDGIIDLEREAKLGGPIHTKAMLILKSYLVNCFARKKPLILTGSLCFEQSYAGIEGDSASGAELAALLSALADAPLKLSLAFTGAVSQAGDILAVGGVTRKIEGFFEVCRRRGLTGKQGVVLPFDNVNHLMLNNAVVQAVSEGKFHIYPVRHISEALEILSGIPSGKLRKDGTFTPGSLYARADSRLTELTKIATKNAFSRR